MKSWLPITLIIAVYLALAVTYSIITPLGEGPDEPGHAAYVFFLAREGCLPDQRTNEVPGEGHQPPLAYALAVSAALWLPQSERVSEQPGNPRFVWSGGTQVNAVAHGNAEFWPWHGAVLAWHLMRLVSVACGAVTVAMTYLAARALQIADWRLETTKPQSAIPLLAAMLIAFNPQFLFVSGLVSNDALLAACCAAMLWLCVRGPAPGRTGPWWHAAALGAVLGVALLVKQSAVVLGPLVLLGAAGGGRDVRDQGSGVRGQRAAGVFGRWLVVFGTAALISGWWFVRNWRLYGDPLGLTAFQAEFRTQAFDMSSPAAWQAGLGQLFSSYWARFGWMNVSPPIAVVWAFASLVALAAFGWIGSGRRFFNRGSLLALVLIGTTLTWLVAFARTAGLVAWQGRLLFPASAAIAMLLANGLWSLGTRFGRAAPQRPQRMLVAPWTLWLALPIALFGIALWLPFGVIRPAYPPPTLREQAALALPLTRVQQRLGRADEPGAELSGWSMRGTVQAGATLELTLLWHALGRQRTDWTVFVHFVDANGTIAFADNRQPQDGMFPTGQWAQGDWIADTRTLTLPPTLAAGSYRLRVGMYDAEGTLERAGAWNAAGELIGDYVELKEEQTNARTNLVVTRIR